jgi:hypothetical protein
VPVRGRNVELLAGGYITRVLLTGDFYPGNI